MKLFMSIRRGLRRVACICALSALQARVAAVDHCEISLDCPENYRVDVDTLDVPLKIVQVASSFLHCSPGVSDEGPEYDFRDTVSVMIVIDHSGSMKWMDSTALRYSLAEKLIDSIYFHSPASEVGIVVFSNQLMFDYRDDSFFKQLDAASGWHDSYVPLTRLNTTVGSMSAVEKLKWAIALHPTQLDLRGYNRLLLNGNYGPTGRQAADSAGNPLPISGYSGGTDISLAFEAARKAFESAVNPPERRYIILLSDGIAQSVDYERLANLNDYMNNAAGMPTTFTVFWINRGKPVPDQIITMTENIRANGYSARNPFSACWTTYGTEVELIDQLINIVSGRAFGFVSSTPREFAINGIIAKSIDATTVYFDKPFALATGVTTLNIAATYTYEAPLSRDTTFEFDVVIRRAASAPEPHLPVTCWEDTLAIYYQGYRVSFIEPDWTSLEVRLIPAAGHEVDSAAFTIMNGRGTDILTPPGVDQTTFFNAVFSHATGTPVVDNILQTVAGDSIIVVYRNPDVLLDTVRIAVPVGAARDLRVQKAYYLDQKGGVANGYPDILRLVIKDTLSAAERAQIQSHIFISALSQRGFSIQSLVQTAAGIDIILTEPSTSSVAPFTGLYYSERLYIDSIPGLVQGGSFPRVDIEIIDSMAPVIVSARYFDLAGVSDTLVVEFSEEVLWIGDPSPFKFSRAGIAEYDVQMLPVSRDSATAVFSIGAGANALIPQFGDSIWIDSLSNIADYGGVRQDGANVKRLLNYLLQYTITSAAFFDTSGDGLIDIVRIRTDRPPDQKMASAIAGAVSQWLPAGRALTVCGLTTFTEGFDVCVAQPAGATPNTAVDVGDVLRAASVTSSSNGFLAAADVAISDSMAPVIIEATFFPGIVRTEGEAAPDTLRVVFSEPVPSPSGTQPFVFYDGESGGTPYVMDLAVFSRGADDATQLFLVRSIIGKEFPIDKDSVRISASGGIADAAGNVQRNDANRVVRLGLRPYRYFFKIDAAPNPVDPVAATVPPSVAALTHVNTGIAIVAQPLARMATHVTAAGRIKIYDAVGNMVWKSDQGAVDGATGTIAFVWDGRNRANRRYVGRGTYVALIHIEDNQGFSEDRREWIGIKKD